MQRLGKNIGKYSGEAIDIDRVLAEIESAANDHGWQSEAFLRAHDRPLLALTREASSAAKSIYISAGIHGDEPAGPLAVLQLLREDRWPENVSVWLCPCLNPTGFLAGTRTNPAGFDLNREYLEPKAEETRAHVAWLEKQPRFDVTLCLHEDWETAGFYVYELNPDNRPTFAEDMVRRVAAVCPIDLSEVIEEREAHGGIIRPSLDPRSRPQWPEAFYLLAHKTRLSYTLEAPSDFPLATRVEALVQGVRAVLEAFEQGSAH